MKGHTGQLSALPFWWLADGMDWMSFPQLNGSVQPASRCRSCSLQPAVTQNNKQRQNQITQQPSISKELPSETSIANTKTKRPQTKQSYNYFLQLTTLPKRSVTPNLWTSSFSPFSICPNAISIPTRMTIDYSDYSTPSNSREFPIIYDHIRGLGKEWTCAMGASSKSCCHFWWCNVSHHIITLSQKNLCVFVPKTATEGVINCFLKRFECILLHSDQVSELCPFSWVKWLCSSLQHQLFCWKLLCWIGDFQVWSRWPRASPPANTRNWCQVAWCLRIRHHMTSWIPRHFSFLASPCVMKFHWGAQLVRRSRFFQKCLVGIARRT